MQADGTRALSRRAFVGRISKTAAGTAVALAVTARTSSAAHHRDELGAVGETGAGQAPEGAAQPQAAPVASVNAETTVSAPWELLRPLTVGASVTKDWRVSDLTGVVDGSCVVTLENGKGRTQRLHICRNDGRPSGLVYTDRFDLVVMNGGRGDLPTEENFGQAVAEIAHVIAGNEAKHDELMRTLLPQSEREEQFAATARLR